MVSYEGTGSNQEEALVVLGNTAREHGYGGEPKEVKYTCTYNLAGKPFTGKPLPNYNQALLSAIEAAGVSLDHLDRAYIGVKVSGAFLKTSIQKAASLICSGSSAPRPVSKTLTDLF